jgi:hypothetical protein
MKFSLDVRRALKGDCLILHYGTKEKPGLILIDGGPAKVYKPHLKPRLEEIRKARGLALGDPLNVDLLMVSHIDDDHINGILELTRDLVDAKKAQKPLPIRVRTFWHNTFDDLLAGDSQSLKKSVEAAFGPASLTDDVEVEGLDPHTAKVLASVGQGLRLRDDARFLKLPINPRFKDGLILAENGNKIDLGDQSGLQFTVVGPLQAELDALREDHEKYMKKADKTAGVPASYTDKSVANLSSIVVLAEADGKRILLTGDARGDKIIEGLELTGLLKPGGKMHVDILKVPHHGSDRNMKTDFFKRVIADHYVASGDGEHGNPERGTLQMLRDARADNDFTVHLTYPIAELDAGREKDRKKAGKGWSAEKDSLKAFLDADPGFAKTIKIVDEKKAHVIDLLDPLGF